MMKTVEFESEDKEELLQIYNNLIASLSESKNKHPEMSFKIRRRWNKELNKGTVKAKILDLGVEAN